MNEWSVNLRVVPVEFNLPFLTVEVPRRKITKNGENLQKYIVANKNGLKVRDGVKKKCVLPEIKINNQPSLKTQELVEQLLLEIYGCPGSLEPLSPSTICSDAAGYSKVKENELQVLDVLELRETAVRLQARVQQVGGLLGRRLRTRDVLKRKRRRVCSFITYALKELQPEGAAGVMRFSVSPRGGPSGWAEWLKAMRLVARLPAGVPQDFRRKLWLTLAEQHLKVKGVDWSKAEKNCFCEWTNPDDTELGIQIVKDLHRTGCSLFCGSEGRENQAVLKRVLLAYARWNKNVGYCQGFNMLAALILEVMDRSESDSLKVMIYLIEAVLPESYFANNLRGLSVDMAVFRDLLRLRLPRLSAHLDKLQKGANDGSCYEPPLTNVFTMQWFLTLFCNCLPRTTVLRVWDLIFLEGDEVLLTTALAIWDTLQDRILQVESADEFYSVMGALTRETLEAPAPVSEELLVRAARLGPVPELARLRDKHTYNIAPWAHTVQSAAKKGLRLFYSEDETDSSDEGEKLALTTAYGLQAGGRGRGTLVAAGVFGHPDRERLALDISALKQQYARLRERQRQAHIILAAACARQPHVGTSGSGPMSVNHLLMGKSAIVSSRGRRLGPPQGAVPPTRTKSSKTQIKTPATPKSETLSWKEENTKKTLSRRDSIKWKDIKQTTNQSDDGEDIEDREEEGKEVSETEINEIMQSSMRSRNRSESSSYSECSESSTSTSLCDEPNRMSDFDSEPLSTSDFTGDESKKADVCFDRSSSPRNEVSKGESPKDEKNAEFVSYIQEFEDLLDRTNNIENEKGLICVIADEINDEIGDNVRDETADEVKDESVKYNEIKDESVKYNEIKDESVKYNEIESTACTKDNPVLVEKCNFKLDDASSTLVDNFVASTDDDRIDFTSTEESANEEVPEKMFVEFVDSSPGKPLRNYLDEFRKADYTINQEASWKMTEPVQPEIFSTLKNTSSFSLVDTDDDDQITSEKGEASIKAAQSLSEAGNKSQNISECQSTSCERSEVSSISSMSPILKAVPNYYEDRMTFLSYKSPCRADSDAASEISEDEKPIVLKIDKYFEHSPEFFGARKSGTYVSSDEEDDRFMSKMKRDSLPLMPRKPEFLALKLPETKQLPTSRDIIDYCAENKRDLTKYTDNNDSSPSKNKTPLAVQEDFGYIPHLQSSFNNIVETKEPSDNYMFPSSLTPENLQYLKSRGTSESSQSGKTPDSQNAKELQTEETARRSSDAARSNILEKTKSEDLSGEQKKSFSMLDEEIEAIRAQSGRRNSERALKIIQENSKILHRILINQVNKSSFRDSFQEESNDDIKQTENDKELKISYSKIHKSLASPRSSSLDDDLPRKSFTSLAKDVSDLSLELASKRQVESIIISPLTSYNFNRNSNFTNQDNTTCLDTKKYSATSPMIFKKFPAIPETKTDILDSAEKTLSDFKLDACKADENKTDLFGWENKGFNANQRKTPTSYSDDLSPIKPYTTTLISDYINTPDGVYTYNKQQKSESKKDEVSKTPNKESPLDLNTFNVNLNLKPMHFSLPISPEGDKDSTLTAISEVMPEISDYSIRDFTESWKVENNNSLSDSFNLSPSNKLPLKLNETSSCFDNSFKNIRKYGDSPLSRATDTFSKLGECSPLDNISRLDVSKLDTSQSSEVCFVSSSMSFSFDPSVDEPASSKPGTFNSSDTLCQLTSLDQVSTPISPKMTSYSLGKEAVGVSQRDLSLELDRFKLNSEDQSLGDTESAGSSCLRTPTSPGHNSKQAKTPEKVYSPFPSRNSTRQPKELGLRLGLYRDPTKSPSK